MTNVKAVNTFTFSNFLISDNKINLCNRRKTLITNQFLHSL